MNRIAIALTLLLFMVVEAWSATDTPEEALRVLAEYSFIIKEKEFSNDAAFCYRLYQEKMWPRFWDCYLRLMDKTTSEQRKKWRELRGRTQIIGGRETGGTKTTEKIVWSDNHDCELVEVKTLFFYWNSTTPYMVTVGFKTTGNCRPAGGQR